MRHYVFLWVLMGPFRFFYVLMLFNGFLGVLIGPYASSLVLFGPYRSLCVVLDSNGSLLVLIGLFSS